MIHGYNLKMIMGKEYQYEEELFAANNFSNYTYEIINDIQYAKKILDAYFLKIKLQLGIIGKIYIEECEYSNQNSHNNNHNDLYYEQEYRLVLAAVNTFVYYKKKHEIIDIIYYILDIEMQQ